MDFSKPYCCIVIIYTFLILHIQTCIQFVDGKCQKLYVILTSIPYSFKTSLQTIIFHGGFYFIISYQYLTVLWTLFWNYITVSTTSISCQTDEQYRTTRYHVEHRYELSSSKTTNHQAVQTSSVTVAAQFSQTEDFHPTTNDKNLLLPSILSTSPNAAEFTSTNICKSTQFPETIQRHSISFKPYRGGPLGRGKPRYATHTQTSPSDVDSPPATIQVGTQTSFPFIYIVRRALRLHKRYDVSPYHEYDSSWSEASDEPLSDGQFADYEERYNQLHTVKDSTATCDTQIQTDFKPYWENLSHGRKTKSYQAFRRKNMKNNFRKFLLSSGHATTETVKEILDNIINGDY